MVDDVNMEASPRKLMQAIRQAMAGTESVQKRLDEFVAAIQSSMQVRVASIYLLRPGAELELSATEGLKKSAVHRTRLKPGEGLVGHVALTARPLNLADAPGHPLFSYRPETGEDPFNSFLGVPILRGGRTLGVLVVQSRQVLRASVDAMVSGEAASLSRASKEIYETYRMFAYDRKWVGRLREAVSSGLTSEAAVERVRNEHRARLMKARDPYLRARLHDLEDLANRLIRALGGESLGPGNRKLADDAILFARELGPAELLDYDRSKLRGIVLEEGSASSHAAIICRALGIPLVGRADGVLDVIETGDAVLVDGESGVVHIRPVQSEEDSFDLRMNVKGELAKAYDALKRQPMVTKDGHAISLQLNAGLLVDLPQLDQVGADGIGLFRTEFQFMVSDFMPKLKEQTALYREAIDAAGTRPVVFRTLDLGGDKILPYIDPVPEENPAIGWRAIRIALDRPGLMRYQLRAATLFLFEILYETSSIPY